MVAYRLDRLDREITHVEEIFERKLADLEDEVHSLRSELARRDEARLTRERSNLLAGIGALGSVIITLIGIIWAYRQAIFQGRG
jgi:hypothetical protein